MDSKRVYSRYLRLEDVRLGALLASSTLKTLITKPVGVTERSCFKRNKPIAEVEEKTG